MEIFIALIECVGVIFIGVCIIAVELDIRDVKLLCRK